MMNSVFDQIAQELQALELRELVVVAQEQYGLDWVSESEDVGTIVDACVAVEQHNFFG